jgi:hypothetical protein
MDAEYVVDCAIEQMAAREYVGDAFPCFCPDLGPEISATLFGWEIETGTRPVVSCPEDWQKLIDRGANFSNVYWRALERMLDVAIGLSRGRFLVGIPSLLGNYDVLSVLRGPQQHCMDLIDHPEVISAAGCTVADAYASGFERLYKKLAAAGMGSSTWTPFYHDGPAGVGACDFWGLVSGQIASEMILPAIRREMAPMQRTIFHLDGPRALRHLDLLLEIPELNAVQWEYGSGHGRAQEWVDVYRRILDAGKCVHVLAEDPEDALTVLDRLGPRCLWIQVEQEFPSADAAKGFLTEIQRHSAACPLCR